MDIHAALLALLTLIGTPMAERGDVHADIAEIIERSHDIAGWFARGGFLPEGEDYARAERVARTVAECFPLPTAYALSRCEQSG